MGINIVDSEGNAKIKIDDADGSKDTVVQDGKEISYDEAAAKKEDDASEEVTDEQGTDDDATDDGSVESKDA